MNKVFKRLGKLWCKVSLLIALCVSLYCGIPTAFAGENVEGGDNTTLNSYYLTRSYPFESVINNPVYSAMGGACHASYSSFAGAVFANPASMPFSSLDNALDNECYTSYQLWMPKSLGIHSSAISYSRRIIGNLCASYGGLVNVGKPYTYVDEEGEEKDRFTPLDIQSNIALGFAFNDYFSLGAKLKLLNSNLSTDINYATLTSDFFALGRTGAYSMALGITNIPLVFFQKLYVRPLLRTIVAFNYSTYVFDVHGLEFSTDLSFSFDGAFAVAGGIQYDYDSIAFLRFGYRYANKAEVLPSYASLGLGIRILDYAKIDCSYIFASEYLSGGFSVGTSIEF